jgi:hypothetical protein
MIIKLPIIINNKVIYSLFRLIKFDNYFLLSLLENNNIYNYNDNIYNSENISSEKIINKKEEIVLIKILLCNNINGISYFNLYFPLKLFIIENHILSIYFFFINLSSNFKNRLDFFYNLNEIFNNKFKLNFINFDNYNKYKNNIFDLINEQYLFLINNKKFNKEFWEMINLLLNCSGFILWLNNLNNINSKSKLFKKIISISNNLKTIEYSINYSNDYNIINHIKAYKNNNLKLSEIKENKYYFLSINDKKYIFIKILKIDNTLIHINCFKDPIFFDKYKWFIYPCDTKINYNKIYLKLLNNNNTIKLIINKFNCKFNNNTLDNIIKYFIEDQKKSNLYEFILENNLNDEIKTHIEIINSNNFTNSFFISICNRYSEDLNLILEPLFNNYIYPIKYNKKEIDINFDYILYYSILNLSKIIIVNEKEKYSLNNLINTIIPNKLKIIYFNILKIFYQLINKKENIIKNINDYSQIQFLKIFLSSDSLSFELIKSKITEEMLCNFKKTLNINYLLNDMLSRLSWNNINKRLNYLKIIFNNKKELYFNDKINKNLFSEDFDSRIKSIIINPFEMFKFLRKECDFIKWIYFLENKCYDLYINSICLNSIDFDILGKIVYNLVNIKEQNFNDKYYKKIIYYGNKNPKLILDNFRINLKIKENFGYLKCNINLGILSKHLSQNKDNIIELTEEYKDQEIKTLKNNLKIMTQKYLKYKKKYFEKIK